ncbi:MAG: hypothetical protein LBI42_11975 [Chitinispirillales bacterium]|nr:hypothetical protein [Chitinispirillales bacterium]
MPKTGTAFLSFLIAVTVLSPQLSFGQKLAPDWVNDSWRSMNYPQAQWYVGFSQDNLRTGSSMAEAIRRVEHDAKKKMSESITVRISAASQTKTTSSQTRQDEKVAETIGRDYEQIVQASTNAEVARAETYSWHDKKNNKIYAFAAVKKSHLASYYVSMIESGLNEAQAGFDIAKELAEKGNNREAAERIAESKKRIEPLFYYRDLLLAVDTKDGLKRSQSERINRLLRQIDEAQAGVRDEMFVYVSAAAGCGGEECGSVVPALETLLTENNCRIAQNEEEAGFILRIDAKIVNVRAAGAFHYCNAQVRVELINTKTGKNETLITINGPKEGGVNAQAAAQLALRTAVPDVWAKIKDKIVVN